MKKGGGGRERERERGGGGGGVETNGVFNKLIYLDLILSRPTSSVDCEYTYTVDLSAEFLITNTDLVHAIDKNSLDHEK